MMSDQKFASGDRVRHSGRPEWGTGTVTKIEPMPVNGHVAQRLSIRFPNAGVKTIVTGHAELQRVTQEVDALSGDSPSISAWDKLNESDWLSPLAKRKVEEAMTSLPPELRDPFNSLQKRLAIMLGLFRFDRSGRGLMDWAVAQTGLDDPLTRFTRQDLEQRFDRWAYERENQLAKLMQEARAPGADASLLAAALQAAPVAARDAVRRLANSR